MPSASFPSSTGMCSDVAVSMVLMCAGISSGPSVSWLQPAFCGEAVQRGHQIVEHRRIGVFLNRKRCRGVADEQRQPAIPCRYLIDKFGDLAGEIDEAGALRLHAQQR